MHGKAGMPEDLVEALKRKEPAAFEWLMARHGSLLHRVAWRLMGQQEEAEEVLRVGPAAGRGSAATGSAHGPAAGD